MSNITTKELFDMYFADPENAHQVPSRQLVDKPRLYVYEQEIGKQLIDMNIDELFGLIRAFISDKKVTGRKVSANSYNQLASLYRSIFNYYIDNITPISNPWNNKRMRGAVAWAEITKDHEPFSKEKLDDIIAKIHDMYYEDRADYIECFILMFYDGFYDAKEILNMKESDINFRTKKVTLPGRTIKLSDRCFELLVLTHSYDEVQSMQRGSSMAASYCDSYFKFMIRPSYYDEFQQLDEQIAANRAYRIITQFVNVELGTDLNYRTIYFLGFYDYVCKVYGKERTEELIRSSRNRDDAADLMSAAHSYGVPLDNVSYIKKCMTEFI